MRQCVEPGCPVHLSGLYKELVYIPTRKCRLESVRHEAQNAEQRAEQLAAEVKAASEALKLRENAYGKAINDFMSCVAIHKAIPA